MLNLCAPVLEMATPGIQCLVVLVFDISRQNWEHLLTQIAATA